VGLKRWVGKASFDWILLYLDMRLVVMFDFFGLFDRLKVFPLRDPAHRRAKSLTGLLAGEAHFFV